MDADPSCGSLLIMSTAFSTAAFMSVAERKEMLQINVIQLNKGGHKSRMSRCNILDQLELLYSQRFGHATTEIVSIGP